MIKVGSQNMNMENHMGIGGSVEEWTISDLVLDGINALIYICRLDDFQILYMNNYAKQLYGDGVGKVCWQWIQKDGEEPCPMCAVNYLNNAPNKNSNCIWEQFNTLNNKWYEIHNKIIDWHDGTKAKLQVAYNIDHRKIDDKKLRYLFKQQELFAKIATTFNINKAFAYKVNDVLDLVGNFVNISRLSLFENLSWKENPCLTYEWCKDGISPKINILRELVFDSSHPSYLLLIKSDLVIVNDLNNIKYRDFFDTFRKFDVSAMLFMPLYLSEIHIGYVTFEVCNDTRIWQNDEIQLLKTFGNIISTAFERKNMEEKRLRSEVSLLKANATKDKFFSIISRDLLAPYSSLISLSTMLLDNYSKWPEEKRRLFVDSIRESSKQGYKLLENLIIWSKIQSGTIEFFPTDVDLRSALSLAAEQLLESADNKNIRLHGIPEDFIFVYADYHMLHCIIKNLLSNAIKFTPENGEINIDFRKYNDSVEVSVCDNGIGIEKAYINSLFKIERFSNDFAPTEEKGTGLGLIICREFVEKNRGKIWVESKLGEGSCFKFTVPLSK
jgi:signal transduction histidine kinase